MKIYSEFISESGLSSLKSYKYVSGEYSKLDLLINPYWIQMTEMFPLWVAPNLITLIGFLFLLSSALLFISFDLKMNLEQPSLNFFFAALAIFAYLNLDAIDGKQARRIGKGSPLGQLFDHGCDCMGITLFTYNLIVMWKLGDNMPMCFLACFVSIFMFYSSNWSEYHTHVLVTSNGSVGTTEMEILMIIFNILTGIFGTHIWQFKIIQWKICEWLLTGLSISIFYNSFFILKDAYHCAVTRRLFWFMLIPISMVYLSIIFIFGNASSEVCLFNQFWSFELVFNLITFKIIICSVTKVRLLDEV